MAIWNILDQSTLDRLVFYARGLIVFGLAAFMGLIGAKLFWLLVEPAGSVSRVSPDAMRLSAAPANTHGHADIALLFRANPFVDAGFASEIMPDAPETTLNLKLVGLRAATGDALGAAMIVTPDNRQSLYAPGDEILDNVYLDRVLTDRVILKKGDVLESLLRDGHEGKLLVIGGEEVESAERETTSTPEPALETRPPLERQAFIQGVRLNPVREDGRTTGYKIVPRNDAGILQQVGLQDGDIVTVINGTRIADIDTTEVFGLIGAASQLDMEVLRGEESIPVRIEFGAGN